jgi:predicted Zn-dependent peptidase
MSDFHYEVTRLPNGARVASVCMPHMRSVSVGVWAGVGGRHEKSEESGMSHFLEHMLFKGTKRRSARQITVAVEGVGGYLNAFTTEDHTCYYAKAGVEHFERLCDVLGDMYADSTFPVTEVEREREVVREEILMYRDQPAQHAQELLSSTLWPQHPLGRPLTGTVDTLAKFDQKRTQDFFRANYNASNTVVTVAGRVSHKEVVEACRPWLGRLPRGKRPRFQRSPRVPSKPRLSSFTHDSEQMHLAMGFHAWGRRDERRFSLKLLSVVLGENMSSRLFQKLRERHGFCYSVSSGMLTLEDTGALHICAGLDPSRLTRATKMILKEIEALGEKGPTRSELKMAQDYTIGQTFMGLESTTNQIMWMGESLLGYGHVLSPGIIERRIHALTRDDLKAVAKQVREGGRLGVAIVGPVKNQPELDALIG